MQENENPGWQAGASSDLFWMDGSRFSNIAMERRAQILSRRFALSPWLAVEMAALCFGGARNE